MMEFTWKIGIALIFLCIIGLVIISSLQSRECFDSNVSKWQQANADIKNTEVTDPNGASSDRTLTYVSPNKATSDGGAAKEAKNQEINDKLNNTLGEVLLDYDFEDTGDLLDEGRLQGISADSLACSKSCCGSQGWLPKELQDSKNSKCNRDLVRSNLTCANGQNGSGCVCLPRKNFNYIARRGNNSTFGEADR